MKGDKRKHNLRMLFMACLFLWILVAPMEVCTADDHKGDKKHSWINKHDKSHNVFRGIFGGGRDEGNEATGQIAAWSLGVINLTVAISLVLKGLKRFAPLSPELKNSITKFNGLQKKYLMPFHCYLNPVFVGVAIVHWTLSRCQSTALTEWGLLAMCFIAALGIVLKFKLVSSKSLRNVYKVHTQPVIFMSLICLVLIGHLIMD